MNMSYQPIFVLRVHDFYSSVNRSVFQKMIVSTTAHRF